MTKSILLLSLLLAVTYVSLAEKQITLNNGKKLYGEIINETDSTLQLKKSDRVIYNISKNRITSIAEAKTIIMTKSGTSYVGDITKTNNRFIIMMTVDGLEIEIPRNQIVSKGTFTPEETQQTTTAKPTASYYYDSNNNWPNNENFREELGYDKYHHGNIGITFLDPGGINLVVGNNTSTLGFRLQGGFIGDIYGIMGSLLFNLKQTENFDSNFGLCIGSTAMVEKSEDNDFYTQNTEKMGKYTYCGISLDFNYHGIFLEIGATIGKDDFETRDIKKPALLLQFGYLFRI